MKYSLFKHIILAVLLTVASSAAVAEESGNYEPNVDLSKVTPSGTIEMNSTSIRLLFGGSWGTGTLHYQGKSYPFKVKGLSAGGIGVKAVDAVGEVYFLNRLEDFEGQYGFRSGGLTVYKGENSRSTYDNNKGVVFTLKAKTTGLALSLGLGGISIAMEK
ncbi:MAG: hypothetical protein OQL16_00315 [Gammaproteobacteria bacterium]|nr:hypothetical protein [Gammaproteobacteria bacterium]